VGKGQYEESEKTRKVGIKGKGRGNEKLSEVPILPGIAGSTLSLVDRPLGGKQETKQTRSGKIQQYYLKLKYLISPL